MTRLITQGELSDKLIISKHLSRILNRHSLRSKDLSIREFEMISMSDIHFNRIELIDAIARDLKSIDYRLGTATRKLIRVDKWRVLYEFDLIDRVVMGVLAEALNSRLCNLLSSNIHSFLPGRSNIKAIQRAARFIRRHHLRAQSPKDRELIVWRFDIKSYTDSIPVHEHSPLWAELQRAVCRSFEKPEWAFEMFKQGLRPVVRDHNNFSKMLEKSKENYARLNGPSMNTVGVTTGTAFAPIAANLYLSKFDNWISRQPGFFARYGDDVLYINRVSLETEQTIKRAREIITELGLKPNQKKEKLILLTGRGRIPGNESNRTRDVLEIIPSQFFEFLGWQINHRGDYQPNKEKITRELNRIKRRVYNTRRILQDRAYQETANPPSSRDKNFQILVELVSNIRNTNSSGDINFTNRNALRKLSSTLQKSLDRHFARFLSSNWTGDQSPRTFRRMSWSMLVNKFSFKNIQGNFRNSKYRFKSK